MKYLKAFKEKRLLILKQIYTCTNDVCGCDLINNLDLSKTLVSYHIKILKELTLITEVKCGRKKVYTINKEKKDDIINILNAVKLLETHNND